MIRYKVNVMSSTQELVEIHNMYFMSSKQELVEILINLLQVSYSYYRIPYHNITTITINNQFVTDKIYMHNTSLSHL